MYQQDILANPKLIAILQLNLMYALPVYESPIAAEILQDVNNAQLNYLAMQSGNCIAIKHNIAIFTPPQ